MSELAQKIAAAIRARKPLPSFPADLSLPDAYRLQSEVARLVSPEGYAGIKAGVTGAPLQKIFNIDHALLGRLYRHGMLEDGAIMSCPEGQVIECELGIMVNQHGEPKTAGFALEFAYLAFDNPADASAVNLTAGNVAADRLLLGKQLPWRDSYDDIVFRLYHNDELVNEAPVSQSLDGPEKAVSWMLKEAGQYGFDVADNTLLMTGACGKVLPALPGSYRADCGELGGATFTIS